MNADQAASAWAKEFASAGIPSSQRIAPTASLLAFLDGLAPPAGSALALDLGCGFGRNTLELARRGYRVEALDMTPACVEATRAAVTDAALAHRVGVTRADLGCDWPIADRAAVLAVDCFCFKHIIAPDARATYLHALQRVLHAEGALFLSCASVEDGYYGAQTQHDDGAGGRIIIDPVNGIASRLYTADDLALLFDGMGAMITEKRSRNAMHGREYDRVTWLVTRKP